MSLENSYISTDSDSYRITGTRVSLDSIVYDYLSGLSPEAIADNFDTLSLEQVYGAITFYLSHRDEVDHLPHTNLRHIIFHAALESMVCTTRFNNRKQVTKRLPQLINITADRATAIYDLCVGLREPQFCGRTSRCHGIGG